jgi:hypothetical protein
MSEPLVERFLRHVREVCAGRHDVDRPDYERHDWLMSEYRREIVNVAPAERERIEREIRRGTGC